MADTESINIEDMIRDCNSGKKDAAAKLFDFAYANFNDQVLSLKAAQTLDRCLPEAAVKTWYLIARLYINGEEGTRSLEIMNELAAQYYPPAQWRLGRMHVYGHIEPSDYQFGMNMLILAKHNGHIKAAQTIAFAKASKANAIPAFFYRAIAVMHGLRSWFRKRVLRRWDERVL